MKSNLDKTKHGLRKIFFFFFFFALMLGLSVRRREEKKRREEEKKKKKSRFGNFLCDVWNFMFGSLELWFGNCLDYVWKYHKSLLI